MFLFGKKKKTPNVVTNVETTEVPAGGLITGTVTVNLSKPLESSGLVLMLRCIERAFSGMVNNKPTYCETIQWKSNVIIWQPKSPEEGLIKPGPRIFKWKVKSEDWLSPAVTHDKGDCWVMYTAMAMLKPKALRLEEKPQLSYNDHKLLRSMVSFETDFYMYGTNPTFFEKYKMEREPKESVESDKKITVRAIPLERVRYALGEIVPVQIKVENLSASYIKKGSLKLMQDLNIIVPGFTKTLLSEEIKTYDCVLEVPPATANFNRRLELKLPTVDECERVWPSWWGKAFTISHHFVLTLDCGTFSSLKIRIPLSVFDRLLFPEEITADTPPAGIPKVASGGGLAASRSKTKGMPLSTSRKLNVDAFTASSNASPALNRRETVVFN